MLETVTAKKGLPVITNVSGWQYGHRFDNIYSTTNSFSWWVAIIICIAFKEWLEIDKFLKQHWLNFAKSTDQKYSWLYCNLSDHLFLSSGNYQRSVERLFDLPILIIKAWKSSLRGKNFPILMVVKHNVLSDEMNFHTASAKAKGYKALWCYTIRAKTFRNQLRGQITFEPKLPHLTISTAKVYTASSQGPFWFWLNR